METRRNARMVPPFVAASLLARRRSPTRGRTTMSNRKRAALGSSLLAVVGSSLVALNAAGAEGQRVPDSFTAKTAGMTPAGVAIKIDVVEWPDESARANVLSALTAEEDVQPALVALPTIGYVWQSGSAVGYSIKYAHRAPTAGGGERITIVTERPVGSYDYEAWTVGTQADSAAALDYSVIELYVDGERGGVGTMSLSPDVEVTFDEEAQTVSLDAGESAVDLLTEVARVPKPYWAEGG